MSATLITAALTQAITSLDPALTAHWPNQHFKAPEKGVWIKPHFMCNPAEPHTNFADGIAETLGYVQIDVMGPIGRGLGAHNEVIERLEELLKVGSTHTYETDTEVTITKAGRIKGFEVGKHWNEITIFHFRSYAFYTP